MTAQSSTTDSATAPGNFPARISIVTLGVADLDRSTRFYEDLGWRRSSASSPEIVWFRTADSVLGLFPTEELAADAGVPATGEPSFRGVTLAVNLESPALVDAAMTAAVEAGAVLVKPPVPTSWGGYSGYFEDPDGHLWELAHNPFFPFTEGGSLDLP
ncbi:VOC family protein [Kitasatospora sp. NPDC056446]|uniref:VOC family protein n=1 Tax=Kitasatospora sp. NPDC056446 TaxID=3345819 RepID=UPI0036B51B2C